MIEKIEPWCDKNAEFKDSLLHFGKIEKVEFGFVHDIDFLFGLQLGFKLSDGWHVSSINNLTNVEHSKYSKFTVEERNEGIVKCMLEVIKILRDAKVNEVKDLVGKPVIVRIENNTFKEFRILTEVL